MKAYFTSCSLINLEEAIKIYESIPADRLHRGKRIGFDLQDGNKDYSGEYKLMCCDRVDRELIDMIPHYKESLSVVAEYHVHRI